MQTKVRFGPRALCHLRDLYAERKIVALLFANSPESLVENIFEISGDRLSLLMPLPDGVPEVSEIERLQGELWSEEKLAEAVLVAIGGGSVMDTAKVLRFVPEAGQSLASQLDREVSASRLRIPLVLCPTTAGTGSEVTPTATLWDFKHGQKHSFFGPSVAADIALVDPELTFTLGPVTTRDSGIDALSHALESIWNKNRNPNTLSLAIAASQRIMDALPIAIEHPLNVRAREDLSLGALWAGQAMAVTQTSLAHALSYQDTLEMGLPHGHSVGRWLPYVCEIARKGDPEVGAWLKQAMGPDYCHGAGLEAWLQSLGITPVSFDQDAGLLQRVEDALRSPRGRNFSGVIHV